jgi:hypothetical protein
MPGADRVFRNILRGKGHPVRFPDARMDKAKV